MKLGKTSGDNIEIAQRPEEGDVVSLDDESKKDKDDDAADEE